MNQEPGSSDNSDCSSDRNLLLAQAVDSTKVLEKGVSVTRALIDEVAFAIRVCKKGYVDFISQLAGLVNDAHSESEVDRRRFVGRDENIKERSLELQLLAKECNKGSCSQAPVTAPDVALAVMHVASLRSTKALWAMNRDHLSLRLG